MLRAPNYTWANFGTRVCSLLLCEVPKFPPMFRFWPEPCRCLPPGALRRPGGRTNKFSIRHLRIWGNSGISMVFPKLSLQEHTQRKHGDLPGSPRKGSATNTGKTTCRFWRGPYRGRARHRCSLGTRVRCDAWNSRLGHALSAPRGARRAAVPRAWGVVAGPAVGPAPVAGAAEAGLAAPVHRGGLGIAAGGEPRRPAAALRVRHHGLRPVQPAPSGGCALSGVSVCVGALRYRTMAVQMLGTSGPDRSKSPKFDRIPVELGRRVAETGQLLCNSRRMDQIWPEFDQLWLEVGQLWLETYQFRPTLARNRPKLARSRPTRSELDQPWPEIGQSRSTVSRSR